MKETTPTAMPLALKGGVNSLMIVGKTHPKK
jgi:hypothetical protein